MQIRIDPPTCMLGNIGCLYTNCVCLHKMGWHGELGLPACLPPLGTGCHQLCIMCFTPVCLTILHSAILRATLSWLWCFGNRGMDRIAAAQYLCRGS